MAAEDALAIVPAGQTATAADSYPARTYLHTTNVFASNLHASP